MHASYSGMSSLSAPGPLSVPGTTVEVVVKDAALTRLLCGIPACLCAVSLAQEAESRTEESKDGRRFSLRAGRPTFAQLCAVSRDLISSLAMKSSRVPPPNFHGAGAGQGLSRSRGSCRDWGGGTGT